MKFDSWAGFFEMGGYGVYVFGAYGLTTGVMLGLIWVGISQHRTWRKSHRARDVDKEKG